MVITAIKAVIIIVATTIARPQPVLTALSASPVRCVAKAELSREGPPTVARSGKADAGGGKLFKTEN